MEKIRKTILIASVVISLTILGFTAFGKRGFIKLMSLRERMDRVSVEIETLKDENDTLKRELIHLKDTEYREHVIRSKMGMVKDGEVLYIFTPE